MKNLKEGAVDVFIEEEKSKDDEINHVKEKLGYLAFENPSTIAV